MKTALRHALPLVAALAIATAALGQEAAEFSRTIDLGPNGELSISNVTGDIVIVGTSGDTVTINAVKRIGRRDRDRDDERARRSLEGVEIDVSHVGNRVRIETEYRGGRHRGASVDYSIRVPVGTEVSAESVSGDVRVSGVSGPTELSSVSGSVEGRDLSELVRAKAVSGDVDISAVRSDRDIEIASVSGEVEVDGVEARELSVSSVSGDIELTAARCEWGEFESVSGDITYRGEIASAGRYDFASHSGDVTLELDESVGFELQARTYSGDIESEFEMRVTSMSKRGRNLDAVIGDGSAVVDVRTFSGDVELRRRR